MMQQSYEDFGDTIGDHDRGAQRQNIGVFRHGASSQFCFVVA
jgi:hypothetical protein